MKYPKRKEVRLEEMLWDLCRKQDEITRIRESGSAWGLQKMNDERSKLMREIIRLATEGGKQ